MKLRPYQQSAVDGVYESWKEFDSTLLVLPTGTGKTICFAHTIDRMPKGRAMVVAHREELIWQASDKIHTVTKERPEIEMAEYRADRGIFTKSRVVCASVQTLNAGKGDGRVTRFDPFDFGCLIIDEAHHGTASSYRHVIKHFTKNPDLRVLGVTATPDRTDEEALGQIFESVAFNYELIDAINDGWLVPIEQHSVTVAGLDLSSVRTTAGDLNGADLARVMEYEQTLHEIAAPAIEITGDRKAVVFAASVAHAERLCEIFNRHKSESARWVCGETPKEERRQVFSDYAAKRFQYLVNVGVCTEGWDDPGIEVVVMARPTKSRSLYAQMVGRGTRTLPGLVDPITSADGRRSAIEASSKSHVEVVDFVGNSGKHKLVCVADVLGGNYSDEAVDRAARALRDSGKSKDALEALKEAEAAIAAEREAEKERERQRRLALRVNASFSKQRIDPFDVFQIQPWREKGWDKGRQPSEKMLALLDKQGIETEGITYTQARQLIGEITKRWDRNEPSFKQTKLLNRYGLHASSRDEAKQMIDRLAAANWKMPSDMAAKAEPVTVY